jgi:hypothetical protein
MSIFDYFSSYFYNNKNKNENIKNTDDFIKVHYVSINDLQSVNLQPVKDIIPNPSRNMPPFYDKVDLRNLNKAQLNSILNVKLKPTPPIEKNIVYEIRHPCLRELLNKRSKIF